MATRKKKLAHLAINRLSAGSNGKQIIQSLSLEVAAGSIVAVMGPNGSGKSTLAHVLMGHPDYQVLSGTVRWQGKNILKLEPHQRARSGIYLAFQYPYEIPGLALAEFLLAAYQARFGARGSQIDFDRRLARAKRQLNMTSTLLERSVNEGFSGGEKKKCEILQLLILEPSLVILDETDSGLDIDALKTIAGVVKRYASPQTIIIVITHYQRLLRYLKPTRVVVLDQGRIVADGGRELITKLERQGYGWLRKKVQK